LLHDSILIRLRRLGMERLQSSTEAIDHWRRKQPDIPNRSESTRPPVLGRLAIEIDTPLFGTDGSGGQSDADPASADALGRGAVQQGGPDDIPHNRLQRTVRPAELMGKGIMFIWKHRQLSSWEAYEWVRMLSGFAFPVMCLLCGVLVYAAAYLWMTSSD
jgi:hypothetical protein